jgi:hypothetical protein
MQYYRNASCPDTNPRSDANSNTNSCADTYANSDTDTNSCPRTNPDSSERCC